MRVFLSLFVLLSTNLVFAEVTLKSQVSENEIEVGDNFRLIIAMSSEGRSLPSTEPSVPTIEGVIFVNKSTGSSTKAQMEMTNNGVNMKTVRTTTYIYTYQARNEGVIKIAPVELLVEGKLFKTVALQVKVVPSGKLAGRPRRGRRQRGGNSMFADPFADDSLKRKMEQFQNLLNRQLGFGGGRSGSFMTGPKNAKSAFYILVEVDKTEAFEGEQIMVSWYLYTKGRVRDIDTLRYPELKGFWKEDIQIATTLNFRRDTLNGEPYNKALLTSYALFPIEAGQTKIDSYQARATIIGGGLGLSRSYSATKTSEVIPIIIKPLPTANRPADFSGAVGEFQMKVESIDKTVIANQPFSVKVRFDGKGNAKLIELPDLNLPAGVEVYDIKKDSKFFKTGTSYKEFEVLLIPRQPGLLVVPSITASYFDPKKEEYIQLRSQELNLNVLPGSNASGLAANRVNGTAKEVEVFAPTLKLDWNPVKAQAAGAVLPFWFWLLWPLSFVLVLFRGWNLLFGGSKKSLVEDAKNRFSKLYKLLGQKDWRNLGVHGANTIYYVMGEVSGLGGASEELSVLLEESPPSVRRELAEPLKKHLDDFSLIGFGPDQVLKSVDAAVWKKKISDLEKSLYKAIKLSGLSEDKEASDK